MTTAEFVIWTLIIVPIVVFAGLFVLFAKAGEKQRKIEAQRREVFQQRLLNIHNPESKLIDMNKIDVTQATSIEHLMQMAEDAGAIVVKKRPNWGSE